MIEEFKGIGDKGCIAKCIEYVDCKSFNIKFSKDGPRAQDDCELNNATMAEVKEGKTGKTGSVVNDPDWDIMETDDNALIVSMQTFLQRFLFF